MPSDLGSLTAAWALILGRKECLDQRIESSRFMSVYGLLPEIFSFVPSPSVHLDSHWPWEGQMGERIKNFSGNNSPSKVCVWGGRGSSKFTPKVLSRANQDTENV